MNLAEWVPIIVSLLAAVTGVFALVRGFKADRVDAAGKLTEAAMKMIEPLKSQVSDLERDIARLRRRVVFLEGVLEGAHRLNGQVKSLGHVPVYDPPALHDLEKLE